MRVQLIDTLLERHVADSLGRALTARGHEVRATGPVWHGTALPSEAADRDRLAGVVDDVLAWGPDVAFLLRPNAIEPEQVGRLRRSGVTTVAWFADDPLLFAVQSRALAPLHDLTLHTAKAATLALYETEAGVRGLAFPFWTDDVAFPRRYDTGACDLDVVFIGNVHTKAKRWRYDFVAALPLERAIFGTVREDPAGISGGAASDDDELGAAAVRGRLGLNIGQRFVDHAGSPYDFAGLAQLGEFVVPSRVVQLAALGVPTVSLAQDNEAVDVLATYFPPVRPVRDADELVTLAGEVRGDPQRLAEWSEAMHAHYRSHYTADARVRFLERLLADPERWTSLTPQERAVACLLEDPSEPPTRPGWTRHRSRR